METQKALLWLLLPVLYAQHRSQNPVMIDMDGAVLRFSDELHSERHHRVVLDSQSTQALCSFGDNEITVSKWLQWEQSILYEAQGSRLGLGQVVLAPRMYAGEQSWWEATVVGLNHSAVTVQFASNNQFATTEAAEVVVPKTPALSVWLDGVHLQGLSTAAHRSQTYLAPYGVVVERSSSGLTEYHQWRKCQILALPLVDSAPRRIIDWNFKAGAAGHLMGRAELNSRGSLVTSGGCFRSNPILQTLESFTFSVWIKHTGRPRAVVGIVAIQELNADVFDSLTLHEGRISVSNEVGKDVASSAPKVPSNDWVHVAAVFHANGEVTVYVNGVSHHLRSRHRANVYHCGQAQIVLGVQRAQASKAAAPFHAEFSCAAVIQGEVGKDQITQVLSAKGSRCAPKRVARLDISHLNSAGQQRMFRIEVDFGLNYSFSVENVTLASNPIQLARQICDHNDICVLRRWRNSARSGGHAFVTDQVRTLLAQQTCAAQSSWRPNVVLRLPHLHHLGPLPAGVEVKLDHLRRCTSCQMQQEKEIDPKRGALEIKHKVLLVDDWVVEERSHLVRRVQKFTKANQGKPVLEQTLPWEDIGMGFWGAVLHEPKLGMLRMYYHSWANTGISLATSVDGVHWTKPNLGITDVDAVLLTPEGRICPKKAAQETFILPVNNSSPFPRHLRGTANNLLRYRLGNPHWIGNSLAVTTSGSEHRNSSMRYIATYDCSPKNAESGTCISGSEDGVNFNTINGGRPISGRAADTLNTIVFDEQTSRYLLYTRTDFGTSGGWREIRGHRTMSSNLSSFPTGWKTEREWYFDFEGKDEKDRRQMYSLSTFIHEGVHFGIMSVMQYPRDVSEGGFDTHRRHSRDVVDVFWATSRNGLDWKLDWVYRDEPFLDRGADGTWDKDIIVPAASIVTFKGRHWFYYMGCNERHEAQSALTSLVRANSDDVGRDVLGWRERWAGVKKAVGAASTLIDRFMYLIPESPSGQGWLVTKPLRVHGEHLEVNCNATAGWIRVLILEPNTETAIAESEDMHHVDSTRIQVKFQQQDSHWEDLENEIIRLKFVLFNAKLYAFDFAH